MDSVDGLKNLCIQQGYVTSDCQLSGMIILGLIQEGKTPCVGCHMNCSHAIIEKEHNYESYHEKQYEAIREKEERVSKRLEMMRKSPTKVIMYIDCGCRDIMVNVIDLITEKIFVNKYIDLSEAAAMIPSICHRCNVDQILIEINGFGISLYDKIKNEVGIDIVPLVYSTLR